MNIIYFVLYFVIKDVEVF